ncbi:MAG: AraC family transcriptional regulator [Moraxellaceae bacterium]|jgi:DNA-binding response OmpR family regulator|nr:AraC family transcriptional regulator [Moraxellaceae bacterium]
MNLPDTMPPATLLVIDDSPDELSLLTEYLRDARLRLIVAFDGREGFEKAAALQPDLILLDVRMPRTDGFAACRLLKADPRTAGIPVIFLSGANELEVRLQGLRLGAVDYISKPFSPEEVIARVGIHLDLHRRLRELAPAAGNTAAVASTPAALNSTVRAAMDILQHDPANPPSLQALAHQVGTNEKRLTELFRAATGLPVFTWLREERVMLACRLLADSELDIQQIADEVGYGSASNFTTMFRERMGMTPRDYRQARRQQAPAP